MIIEDVLKNRLISWDKEEGEVLYANYRTAWNKLAKDVLAEIKRVEPSLTDHSEKHVKDVLERVWRLLGDNINDLSAVELYMLMLCVLFHDVGNIHGRSKHNIKVSDIYDRVFGSDYDRQEKTSLLKAVRAHCGENSRGNKDTLSEVEEIAYVYNESIRLREIAALLRFSDELAEGPQRSSRYLVDIGAFPDASLVFHKYANITSVNIDKGNSRIALTYTIEYPTEGLEDLLSFTYKRIMKLDKERRYCKYYSSFLDAYKTTDACFIFYVNGNLSPVSLPPLSFGDKYVYRDEDDIDEIENRYSEYKPSKIIEQLESYGTD